MRRVWSLFAFTFLILSTQANAQVDWEPIVELDNQIFPSQILASATMKRSGVNPPNYIGDPQGYIGIKIRNPSENTKLGVTIRLDDYIDSETYEVVLPKAGIQYEVFPTIVYRYSALKSVAQPTPANVVIEISLNGVKVGRRSIIVSVRSVNEAVYAFVFRNGQLVDNSWLFAAFVNEEHPWIDQLLREALSSGTVQRFDGYQSGPSHVYQQVYAIWNVLQRRGFKYSNITTVARPQQKIFSQNVRFLDDSIRTSQANCIDGVVLFASVLRRIGIRTKIVLIPGHALILFDLTNGPRSSLVGLETTMMGNLNLSSYTEEGSLTAIFGSTTKNQASWKSFSAAVGTGSQTYNNNIRFFGQNDARLAGFKVIDIEQARERGVAPITR